MDRIRSGVGNIANRASNVVPSVNVAENPMKYSWILWFTATVLLAIAAYGISRHSLYSCDNGIFMVNKKMRKNIETRMDKCSSYAEDTKELNSCMDEKSKGASMCMKGGLLTFSIIALIFGVLSLGIAGLSLKDLLSKK